MTTSFTKLLVIDLKVCSFARKYNKYNKRCWSRLVVQKDGSFYSIGGFKL